MIKDVLQLVTLVLVVVTALCTVYSASKKPMKMAWDDEGQSGGFLHSLKKSERINAVLAVVSAIAAVITYWLN